MYCSRSVSGYSCPSRDIETVYGSESFNHQTKQFLYAIDKTNFDIAVVGATSLSIGVAQPFFYYITNADDCQVKWHYPFSKYDDIEFQGVAIRSSSNAVYGILETGGATYLFEARTDLIFQDDLNFELY